MSEQNYSIDRDLREVREMIDAFVPYIYEDELYGRSSMSGPSLTPGAILLRLNRLRALHGEMSSSQAAAFDDLQGRFTSISKEWNSHYTKKLVREAEARLRDVQTYLSECKDDVKLCANAYLPEALRRTMIEAILAELPESERESLSAKVKSADSGLRRYVESSEFIWGSALRSVYPESTYWWLYNRPPYPENEKR